jgi:peptidyl-prolyl cis-trans isomerase A (cyclophilin A)
MRILLLIMLGALLASVCPAGGKATTIVIRTDAGEIVAELYPDKAPKTVANFLRYVRAGRYSGGIFHRTVTMGNQPDKTVKIEVVQGGPNPKSGKDFAPIKLERTKQSGLKHMDGTISMARSGPDSATSDFFICIGDQPELDFDGKRNPDGQGFAAFGRVVRGMDVVMKIQAMPAKDQTLTPPIRIREVVVR